MTTTNDNGTIGAREFAALDGPTMRLVRADGQTVDDAARCAAEVEGAAEYDLADGSRLLIDGTGDDGAWHVSAWHRYGMRRIAIVARAVDGPTALAKAREYAAGVADVHDAFGGTGASR